MKKPKLILIHGPIATGKTTTCYSLRHKIKGYAFVDLEALKRMLKKSGKEDAKIIAKKAVAFLVEELMKLKKNIIVQERSRKDLNKAIKKYGKNYKIYSFFLKCNLKEAIRRDKERGDNTAPEIVKHSHEKISPQYADIIIYTDKLSLDKTLEIISKSIK